MNAFLAWLGGKSRLVSTIVPLIPEHTTYAEPFAGAAWVLFGKEESKNEIINDINRDLINLYRVIQNHLEEFLRYFKWALVSRDEFERLHKMHAESMTDIQRAARFYYMQRTGFGGKGETFGVSSAKRPSLNLMRIEEALSEAHIRLARVWIERLPFQKFIERYDRPVTFFYCDPPYHGHEQDYGPTFSFSDFKTLAETLSQIQGKFLLSINDTPAMREVFSEFQIDEVSTSWEMRKANKKVVELLIRNY